MSTFGSYEVVEELHRTPFGYVCSARRTGAAGDGHQGEFVVKVFEAPDTDGDGLPGPIVNGTDHFVGRARLQQKLTLQRSIHWAQIHEMGDSGDSPFYVTDYYPRSAQKLILGRVNLGPAALHEIIDSVVRGLRELRQVCNQSHGCLKPSNVLIGGAGEVSGAKIVLTDPLCGAGGETEHGGDLHALGALIYQLVLHRPFHTTAWPIQESNEWESLGKFASDWRELCNDLLNPDPSKRPDEAAIDRRLAALQPHGISVKAARKVPVKSITACVVLLVLLVAGGGGFVYYRQARSYSRVHQARSEWIDALWNNKTRLKQYASFGAAVITQSEWEALQLPDRPRSASDFSLSAIKRAQMAEATADQVHRRLLDVYGKSAGPLRDLRQSYEHEGYAQAAGYVASILSAPAPDDAHLTAATDKRIALGEKLKASRPGMSPATASALDGLARSGDKDLQAFAVLLKAEFRKQCVLTADGWSGTPQLDQLATRIALVPNWPTGYDAERLDRELKLDPDHLQLSDIQRWLETVNQYARVGPTDAQRAEQSKLAEQLAATSDQIRMDLLRYLANDSPQVQKLDQERLAIRKQIDQLGSAHVRKDLPDAFDAPARKITEQIASLPKRYRYQPTDLAIWFTQALRQQFNTPAARDVWSRWMKGHTADNVNAEWKAQTLALAKTLTDFETKTFVVPVTLQAEPWATPAAKKAQESADRAILQIAPRATELPPEQLAPIRKEFTAWCDEATKLAEEHAQLQKTMINAAFVAQHDARWASESDRKFWATQVEAGAFADVLKADLERLVTIRGILTETSADKLIETSRASNRPEVTLAVWTRLGELQKHEFPGPLTANGVERWSDFLAGVNVASEQMPPPADASMIKKQVAESGQSMCLAAAKADSPDLLKAATAAAARLHLSPDLTAGKTEGQNKWQNAHLNAAEQLAKARNLLDDFQPQAAKAALDGLSGPEIDQDRKDIEAFVEQAQRNLGLGKRDLANLRYTQAVRELKQAARGGSAEAMLDLGQMYRDGTNGLRDRNLAIKFYRRAAAAGNVEAMGEVTAGWFRAAADAGNLDAKAALAQMALHDGNLKQASTMLLEADKLDPDKKECYLGLLMRQLASLYEAKGAPEARQWYQAAAERGDIEAQGRMRP